MICSKNRNAPLPKSSWQVCGTFCRAYTLFTSLVLVVMTLVMLAASLEDWALLRRRDALLGVTIRTVLIVAGLLHLVISGWVFATRDVVNQALLLLWVGVNHLVYRAGLAWLKAATPLPILRVLGMKVGIPARTLDFCWKLWMAYLVIGSLVVLVLAWRRRKRLATEAFFLDWRKTREKGTNLPSA